MLREKLLLKNFAQKFCYFSFSSSFSSPIKLGNFICEVENFFFCFYDKSKSCCFQFKTFNGTKVLLLLLALSWHFTTSQFTVFVFFFAFFLFSNLKMGPSNLFLYLPNEKLILANQWNISSVLILSFLFSFFFSYRRQKNDNFPLFKRVWKTEQDSQRRKQTIFLKKINFSCSL